MIELCRLRKQPAAGQSAGSTLFRIDQTAAAAAAGGTFLRSASGGHLSTAGRHGQQFGRSGSGIVMPATQQPARTGQLALMARLSPEKSLFNRLDGFVLQLDATRDFFAQWPDRICQRIRSPPTKVSSNNNNQEQQQPNGYEQQQQQQQNASAICWTGQGFGSYTKKLVEFGKTNMQDHPEVPIGQPMRVNDMILTFIDKFKIVNDQLVRLSSRLPLPPHNPAIQMQQQQSAATKSRSAAAAVAAVVKSGGDLRRTISSSAGPLRAEAYVSPVPNMDSLLALAHSMPHSMPDETSDGDTFGEPSGEGSVIDELSVQAPNDGAAEVDDSTPSDEDETDDDAAAEDPCKGSSGSSECENLVDSNQGLASSSSSSLGPAGISSDEQLNRLQQQPPFSRDHSGLGGASQDVEHQHQHHVYEPATRFPPRISSRIPTNPYPTPTVSWEQSTAYEDFTSVNRQSSSSSSTLHSLAGGQQLVLCLLVALSAAATWMQNVPFNRQRQIS